MSRDNYEKMSREALIKQLRFFDDVVSVNYKKKIALLYQQHGAMAFLINSMDDQTREITHERDYFYREILRLQDALEASNDTSEWLVKNMQPLPPEEEEPKA